MGVLECKHLFCIECIKDWAAVTNSCPLCKKEFFAILRRFDGGEESVIVQQKKQVYQENLEELSLDGRELFF